MINVVLSFDHRQLLEHSRVFTVKGLNVDVLAADSDERQKKNVAVD